MSGKPYPAGATRAIALIDRIAQADRLIAELEPAVGLLRTATAERARAWTELTELLRRMDVESVGNAGYEGRTAWLLAEVVRQLRGDQ